MTKQPLMAPFEAFQMATTYIAEGDYARALPFLEQAANIMAGDPDFDTLLDTCRVKQ